MVASVACWHAVFAQPSKSFATVEEVDAFVTSYYQRPQPDMIGPLISSEPLASSLAQKPNSQAPYAGFFSEIFAQNPQKLPLWQTAAAKQGHAVNAVVSEAVAIMRAGGVMARKTHSTDENDTDWGAFFASGRAEFVKKLITELPPGGGRNVRLPVVVLTNQYVT